MFAEIQHKQKMAEAEEKRAQVKQAECEVEQLRIEQSELEGSVDVLRDELRDCRERKRRADILMRSLASEKQKWMVCTRMLSGKYKNVAGDVILAGAYITFLSGFTKKYRHRLLLKWTELLVSAGFHVSTSDSFSLVDLFGDSQKVRAWTQDHGLPNDEHSLNNAVVMEKTQRFTICMDPQLQANSWLKKAYRDLGLVVAKQNDPFFINSVE